MNDGVRDLDVVRTRVELDGWDPGSGEPVVFAAGTVGTVVSTVTPGTALVEILRVEPGRCGETSGLVRCDLDALQVTYRRS